MDIQTIGLCSDHAGYDLKQEIAAWLAAQGYACKDYGTFGRESCDYPDFAHALGKAVTEGEAYPGIAICGTGNGMAMTLNKYPEIRAGLCWNTDIARLVRQHNNANVLVLPARFTTTADALQMVQVFLATDFEGGRHLRRIKKIPIKQ